MLEPDEGKLSRPVLRGPGRSNPARLPDRMSLRTFYESSKTAENGIVALSALSPFDDGL